MAPAVCGLGVAGVTRRSPRCWLAILLAMLLLGAVPVARWARANGPPEIDFAGRHRPPPQSRACSGAGRCCVGSGACTELYGAAAVVGRKVRSSGCRRGSGELYLPPEAVLSDAQRVVVVGDSTARRVYEALWARMLSPPPKVQPRVAGRHADHRVQLQRSTPGGKDLVLEFLWRPFAANVR
jgi:hypothetical protein